MADNGQYIKRLNGAKTKINSISSLKEVITDITNTFSSMQGIPELREWIRQLNGMHPLIDNYLESLDYFQGSSEYMGHAINYVHDTSSLFLEDWGKNWLENPNAYAPHSLRKTTRTKIDQEVAEMIDNSYADLNDNMVKNISKEFSEEGSVGYFVSHGAHIVGDVTYYRNRIQPTLQTLVKTLQTLLKDAVRLLNHQYGMEVSIKIENNIYSSSVENNDIAMDSRGNKIVPIATKVNNDVLKPKETDG